MRSGRGERIPDPVTDQEEVPSISDAARKRAAIELIREHERTLRRTARRYSICEDDADDAYQRSLEILLTKAPTVHQRDLIRWMQTVTKHEALAVRRHRERLVSSAPPGDTVPEDQDWIQMIPSPNDGPADLTERRERVARSREALATLKPQELRALTLLAEGYSYREIGELTGWTRTKINRCLAEGRQRFRSVVTSSEEGDRCDEMAESLSAFADGEAGAKEVRQLKEHLRVCAHCRLKLRTFRAAPRAAAALLPVLPLSRSLTERIQEALLGLHSRMPWRGEDVTPVQIAAAGGTRGAGTAMLAKVLAACVGTAGGAAACVATGVIDTPLDGGQGPSRVAVERSLERPPQKLYDEVVPPQAPVPSEVDEDPPPAPDPAPDPAPISEPPSAPTAPEPAVEAAPPPPPPPPESVEFTPEAAVAPEPAPAHAPAPAPAPAPATSSSAGSGAGEFGP